MPGAFDRRIKLLDLLCVRRHDTIGNLAIDLGVSEMTIRRDIDALSNSAPVYTKQGIGGGVYIDSGYRRGRVYLTKPQESLLRELLPGLTAKQQPVMQSILDTYAMPTP